MKLRIRGNSLRLRLGRSEVEALLREGRVTETVRFAPGVRLVYELLADAGVSAVEASLEGATVRVRAPRAVVESWARGEDVGFSGSQPAEGEEPLRVLVEKDWSCLTPRQGEGDEDGYAHPAAGKGEGC